MLNFCDNMFLRILNYFELQSPKFFEPLAIFGIIFLVIRYGTPLFIWLAMEIYELYRLPPGPLGFPLFGCLLHKAKDTHNWYVRLAKKYGKLYSLRLGTNNIICVSCPHLVMDLFNRPSSIGRHRSPFNDILGGKGIVLSEGRLWKLQRQFLSKKFRVLGVKLWTRQRFEKFILFEVDECIARFSKTKVPLDPMRIIGRHVHNVICQLSMSFRFEDNDPVFNHFYDCVTKNMKLFGSIRIAEYFPIYMEFPGSKSILRELKKNFNEICEFHKRHIERRRQQRMTVQRLGNFYEPSDLLDHYLDQIDKENQPGFAGVSIFHNVEPDRQIVQVMNDLFSAGMETSRTTILWSLVMMVREPEVADSVRKELAKVVNPGDHVTLEHRHQLPYVEAVLFETLRRTYVVPLGTTHVNTEDWHVNGYLIPAGSQIIPLINSMNMNPEMYPEPEKFKPERFIKDGALFCPEVFMPFGVGRRICLGEHLARMEIFLFFANIMNNFKLILPEGEEVPSVDGCYGVTHAPLPFKVLFEKRF